MWKASTAAAFRGEARGKQPDCPALTSVRPGRGDWVCWWVRSFQGGGGSSVGPPRRKQTTRNLSLKEIFIRGVSLLIFYFVFSFPPLLFYLPVLRFLCLLCHLFPLPAQSAWLQAPKLLANHGLNETYGAHINLPFLEVVQLRHFVTMSESRHRLNVKIHALSNRSWVPLFICRAESCGKVHGGGGLLTCCPVARAPF